MDVKERKHLFSEEFKEAGQGKITTYTVEGYSLSDGRRVLLFDDGINTEIYLAIVPEWIQYANEPARNGNVYEIYTVPSSYKVTAKGYSDYYYAITFIEETNLVETRTVWYIRSTDYERFFGCFKRVTQ